MRVSLHMLYLIVSDWQEKYFQILPKKRGKTTYLRRFSISIPNSLLPNHCSRSKPTDHPLLTPNPLSNSPQTFLRPACCSGIQFWPFHGRLWNLALLVRHSPRTPSSTVHSARNPSVNATPGINPNMHFLRLC